MRSNEGKHGDRGSGTGEGEDSFEKYVGQGHPVELSAGMETFTCIVQYGL